MKGQTRKPYIIFSVEHPGDTEEEISLANLSVESTLLAETVPFLYVNIKPDGVHRIAYLVDVEHVGLVEKFSDVYDSECYMLVDDQKVARLVYPNGDRFTVGRVLLVEKSIAENTKDGFFEVQGKYFTVDRTPYTVML